MRKHPLQCRCGKVRGHVERPGMATRMTCYCADCQAYAHFLGLPDRMLDAQGGTAIVAVLPGQVRFEQGLDALACMSLSDRGLVRWYASCCNTPIGNTPREFKMPYVGLVDSCLRSDSPSLAESFGEVQMVLGTRSANGEVKATSAGTLFMAMARLMKSVLGARLRGAYKRNPFFDPQTGKPARVPRELSPAERARLAS
jgi:hypothetical protein